MASQLQQKVAGGSILGMRALLGFVADTTSPDDAFLLPVGLAEVVAAECAADVFLFRLRVTEHVDLDDYSLSLAEIRSESRKAIAKISSKATPAPTSPPF